MSLGKEEGNCWSFLHIPGSRDYDIILIINTITQIRDKTTNATQDQIEFEG